MKKLDRYSIVQRIGDGGAATVYKAQQALPAGLTRPVALKVFPALPSNDKVGEARLAREIRPLLLLDGHPHVICFYGAGVTDSIPWIAMEYAQQTAQSLIGDLPGDAAVVARLVEQVADALLAMHALTPPLLHNDLKPSNILIGKGNSFKVGDFGAAIAVGEERTRHETTVQYSAPELLSREAGPVGPAADLYALGHIAYEIALGGKDYRRQFTGVFDERTRGKETHTNKWMAWHCSMGVSVPPIHEVHKTFPHRLSSVIARMMAKPLSNRYASAADVLADLRQAGSTSLAAGGEATPPPPSPTTGTAAAAPAVSPLAARQPGGFARRFAAPSATARPTPPPPPPAPASTPAPATAGGGGGKTLYYVRLRDRRSGPFDFATLQRQVRQGLISRVHQISTDQVNWRPAATFKGLF